MGALKKKSLRDRAARVFPLQCVWVTRDVWGDSAMKHQHRSISKLFSRSN
jgi:hypothetical protein